MALLHIDSLSFRYNKGGPLIFRDLNFKLEEGSFISIVGPSGSGKSTMLKLLAGHLNPTSGHVYFQGEEMEGPDIRLVPGYEEIKLVYQQFELRPNISAKENIASTLNGYTKDYREERVQFLLNFLGLMPYADHKPYELSGGQQQRLAIAKAMANEPEILLMDEPFSALDPMNSALFLKEVKRLAKETNTSVLLVTHDTRDAMMADLIVVLINGEVKQIGTPEEIYYNPNSYQVASFFGPMNSFTSEEMKQFKVQTKTPCYVRADSFIPQKEAGFSSKFKIKEVIFRGAYQVLVISFSEEKDILVFDFQKKFRIEEDVYLSVNKDEIIRLKVKE